MLMTGYFGGYSTQESALAPLEVAAAQVLAEVVTAQSKPVVVHTIYPDGPDRALLRAAGIPVHRDVDRAAAMLAGLVERPLSARRRWRSRLARRAGDGHVVRRGAEAVLRRRDPFAAARTVRQPAELEAAFVAAG